MGRLPKHICRITPSKDVIGVAPISGANLLNGNGVFVNSTVFGGPGIRCFSVAPINNSLSYNLGRTLTHEIGHYFGLSHIFSGCSNEMALMIPLIRVEETWVMLGLTLTLVHQMRETAVELKIFT